jgi:hypothetical protein
MMLKSLVVVTALAIAAPAVAFGGEGNNQQNTPATQSSTGPSGPAFLTVNPPGLANNPHGPPTNPLVFTAGGQPTGGSPNENGGNGVAHFRPASP